MPHAAFENLPTRKKDRLIQQAKAEFLSKTYARATMRNLVKRMNISTGSFYKYFRGKDDLFLYIYDGINKRLYDAGFFSEDGMIRPRGHHFQNALPKDDWSILNMFRILPEDTLRKYIFDTDTYGWRLEHHRQWLIELQNKGLVRRDIDIDLAVYMYRTTSYNLMLYIRSHNLQDIEEIRRINRSYCYNIFTKGILVDNTLEVALERSDTAMA